MNRYKILILSLVIGFISCQKKEDVRRTDEASVLFEKSAELIISYTQKINTAPDSAAVDSLYKTYEKHITDINFSVPPQTDLYLSEQENDSLYTLLQNLNASKSTRLSQLKVLLRPDSVD